MDNIQIKKQQRHLLLLNVLIFSLIFICFGIIIYQMTNTTLSFQVDSVIQKIMNEKDIAAKKDMTQLEKNSRYNIQVIRWSDDGKPLNSIHEKNNPLRDYPFRLDKKHLNKIVCKRFGNGDDDDIYYRSLTKKFQCQGQTVYVEVLVVTTQIHDAMDHFKDTLFICLIFFCLLSFIISYYLAKQAMKPIIHSWKSQQRFVEDASHELRTPLAVIQAKLEQLFTHPRNTILDESENIAISLNEVRRLEQLIKDLSILAKSNNGSVVIHKRENDISDFISQAVSPYIEIAAMHNRHLSLDDEGEHQHATFDEQKIQQLLVILIDNAIKYTDENGRIQVRSYCKNKNWIIEVADNGLGVPDKKDKQLLFDRFYRVDSSRTRETGGTGLGLSIAKSIVDSHQGSIEALDNTPKGLLIRVSLPIKTNENKS